MSVYVAPSIYRAMDPRTATAVFAAINANPSEEHVIWEPLWNDALISRSRSIMATKFIEQYPEADVIVFIDDDMVFAPDDFWKIVEGARETESIYGGFYVTRSTEAHLASRVPAGTQVTIQQTVERRPVEIEYLATGFMAVHRSVIERMLAPDTRFRDANGEHRIFKCSKGAFDDFYPVFHPFVLEDQPGSYHMLSEDWAFCERARQLGFKVWGDQSIILQHMGLYPFTVADLNPRRKETDPGLPSTGTDLLETKGHDWRTGEPLIDDLLRDVAEWSGDEKGDVQRLMAIATASLAERWTNKPADETEEEWYLREDVGLDYILDLAYWHRRGGCPLGLFEGADFNGTRFLDYGAGIGTSAMIAASRGATVSVYEPNPTVRNFLTWRAERHGIAIEVLDGIPLGRQWDSVMCWHVFEHVAEPEALLRLLLALVRPGGVLLTDSEFKESSLETHPMHHVHEDWEGAMARNGLERQTPGVYARPVSPVAAG